MDFDHLIRDCKDILLRVLNTEEHRFQLSEQAKKLVHKCGIFSAPLHTISESRQNTEALALLRGSLIDVERFIARFGDVVDEEEMVRLDEEYNVVAVRIARAAYKIFRESPDRNSIGKFDLLHRDCIELLRLIFAANPKGFLHPEDCERVRNSSKIFEDLLPRVHEDHDSVDVLVALEMVLDDVVDFLYVTSSSITSSVLAKIAYSTNKAAYHHSVEQLLIRLAKVTHQVKHRVPRRLRPPQGISTEGFEVLKEQCKTLLKGFDHLDSSRYVNAADCRKMIISCIEINEPLRELRESGTSLAALEELLATLNVMKHFLDTYSNSSVLGETTYLVSRSTYESAWDDVMTRLGHDLHVLRRNVMEQKNSFEFRTDLAECQALLTSIRSIDDNRELNPSDCNLLTRSCNEFVDVLHNIHQTETNAALVGKLKVTLMEVKEFLDEFEKGSSPGATMYTSNRNEYSREFGDVLQKIDRALESFRTGDNGLSTKTRTGSYSMHADSMRSHTFSSSFAMDRK